MTLNLQAAAVLAALAELPPIHLTTITPDGMCAGVACEPLPGVAEVRDLMLDLPGRTIAARLYRPDESSSASHW